VGRVTRRRLSSRQREILRRLEHAGPKGVAIGFLPSGDHSGNVLERLLVADLLTITDRRAYLTGAGRRALETGFREFGESP
jgi:hypothetical protein